MRKILIVDDEVQILKALSRMFLDTDYEIFSAANSTDAMELLTNTEIDMVISDMRMPLQDGYTLLSMIKEKYPKIIRIILSGYADEKPMFKALLHNIASLYVFKPWNNNDFLSNVKKLFEDDDKLRSNNFLEQVNTVCCNLSLSKNCDKMIKLIEEENMDLLIQEIEQAPDIAALLQQVAKSAVYGAMPNAVKPSALYMGLHNLKCFLHFACLVGATKPKDSASEESLLLVKHAYATNRIYLFLYEALLHKQPPEAAMFAGLMHNIGLFILAGSTKQNTFVQVPMNVSDYVHLELGEHKELHQELGAHFTDQWDLPFFLYEAALYHHKPLDSNIIHQELVTCVHIAQAYAWKALGYFENDLVDSQVFDTIGISQSDFEKRLSRYMK